MLFWRQPTLFILSLLLLSCSYTNRRQGVNLQHSQRVGGPQRVFIPVLDNRSSKPGMEVHFTSALRNALADLKGLKVTDRADEADFLLLGSVQSYERTRGGGVRTGDAVTAAAGEISAGQNVATDIRLRMNIEMRFLEKIYPDLKNPAELRRTLWTKEFDVDNTFEASSLYSEARGSSSAPNINEARETLQIQTMAENLARQVVDQVMQNF